MRTILVTGGAGFVGSNFVRYWYDHHPDDLIIVLDTLTYAGRLRNIPQRIHQDHKRFEFFMGSVTSIEMVNSLVQKADIVVHFAAETHVTRSILESRKFFETDILGTHTVANAVLKFMDSLERFVHISTSEVYGSALKEPMDEEHPLNPCSPYASAKCGADRLVHSYFLTYGIPAVILRPFNQYGPRQHLEKVVPRFITSAINNEPLTIHGDGSARRDWLYVEDTCRRIEAAIEAPLDRVLGEAINIGSGEALSVLKIARMILKEMGKPEDMIVHLSDRPGQVSYHISSTDKAQRLLGILPGRPFREGLQQTIEWYVNHRDWWREIEWMKHVKILTRTGQKEMH
ncbi:dTDP-glucose 4,6-dehydratase [Desulfoferrobacter suflitae]|uniref:dTDP-glucose 4,6-dehydratase n=1 Tax=Desulfoferrobacter suflitae TaxID=2865782 RepID=UPI0021643D71|nr:GDP-mannose 4,6-dehydratase [Desulfoferrobacter suflitae]MCK8603260.1 GDP-mannose 4,6-dehydratase [Desulfoferrobacter suflitae]